MSKQIDEIQQRTRRIETRLTQLMIAQGISTEHQRPMFDKQPGEHATLQMPSIHTSWKEISDALPDGFDGRVVMMVGDDAVGHLDIRV